MGRQVFGADAFARLAKRHEAPTDAIVRGLFAPKIKAIDESSRSIDFTISTGMIDRDNDTIAPNGWKLDAYLQNPVVLWAHDQSCPPVARAENTRIASDALISTSIFTSPDLNPFGDMIFRMYVAKFLNATSVGFKPIEYTMRSDDGGSFGVDYAAQELLEYSCVAVPSNPQALARAKASGIDTAPMIAWCAKQIEQAAETKLPRELLQKLYRAAKGESPTVHHMAPASKAEMAIFNLVRGELDRLNPDAKAGRIATFDLIPGIVWIKGSDHAWSRHIKADSEWKSGASRDLPTSDRSEWDGPAAAKRMLDDAGFDGDSPDIAKAKRGFLAYDSANEKLRGSYKLPFSDLVEGKLTVIAGGVRAAASRLPGTDIPDSVKKSAQAVLDHYKEKLGIGQHADDRKTINPLDLLTMPEEELQHLVAEGKVNIIDCGSGAAFLPIMDQHRSVSVSREVKLDGTKDGFAIFEPVPGSLKYTVIRTVSDDEGAVDKIEEIPLDPDNDEATQGDPDGDANPQDELLIGDENERQPEQTFETAGGPGDHEHEYDLGEAMTKEAGDPPHVHGITWGQDGTVTIGEAEGHTHEPDFASLNQIDGDGMPNGTGQPQISDEAVPMRDLAEMMRKIVREELEACVQKPQSAVADVSDGPELILLDDEPEETKSPGILDAIDPDELAGMIDGAVSAAMTRAIRRAQGKID